MSSVRHAIVLFAIAFISVAEAEVTVPCVISDHMVLQRESLVPIWGWADAGETVTVTLGDGEALATTADDTGQWRVDLTTGQAGGPYTLTITGDATKQQIVFKDVLLGEVWLCSGQSNMEWPVKSTDNANTEIASANWPQIRHLKVPRALSSIPQDNQPGTWKVCSPQTAGYFTAVGYYFGRTLHENLNVPIGLINCSWGGTRIEPWTPAEGFKITESLRPTYQHILLQDPSSEQHIQRMGDYINSVEDWIDQTRSALAVNAPSPILPAMPVELLPFTDRKDPTVIYNGMIQPIAPYRIRGAIWYQGESNHRDTDYVDKSLALVRGWREVWQKDIPFYYVQIAPYQYGTDPPHVLPEFWEQQASVATELNDTAMVVINDIGNLTSIHPTNKQDVGKRLGNVALARTYNRTGIVDTGPRFEKLTLEGDTLRVTFDHVGGGLISRDGKPPNEFQIVGRGTGWRDADATIDGNSIVLSAEDVKQPTAVRFAWHKLATPNLMNIEGLPAAPFRAGDVPDDEPLVLHVGEVRDYQLIYDLDLHKLGKQITYHKDLHDQIRLPFDRVAYFLELKKPDGPLQWVYVSMDAFTEDPLKTAVPTLDSGAHFQKPVSHLHIVTNDRNLPTTEDAGGNIEFWPNDYAKNSGANIPNASSDAYDFDDKPNSHNFDGYGSMQVHFTSAQTTLFAINHWVARGTADLGIGNAPTDHPDWTLHRNAGDYEVKRLRIFVRPSVPIEKSVPREMSDDRSLKSE
jgi:sialate O-acetylesterase